MTDDEVLAGAARQLAQGAAFDEGWLRAVATIRAASPVLFARMRERVKAAGVPVGEWDAAVRALAPRAADRVARRGGLELRLGADGAPRATLANTCAVLRDAPGFRGRLAYNEMLLRPALDGVPMTDGDIGRLREQIEREHGFAPSAEVAVTGLLTVAEETRFHPAREHLQTLPKWDGTPRLAAVAERVLGVVGPDASLAARLLRKWFVAAVARVMEPGCKFDCALVLVGPQGLHKSTFFAVLGGPFFLDCDMDIESKDAVLQMRAGWIVEWGEIERITSRKQADVVKAFLSRARDTIRAPFLRGVDDYQRSSVIVGTTNKTEFLVDETGDRRFWVVEIGEDIDVQALRSWRSQLWAEAIVAYHAGERWWLDPSEEVERAEAAASFRVPDPWEPLVREWLERNAPTFVTVPRLLTEALGMYRSDIRFEHQVRIGKVMAALRWPRRRPRRGNPERDWGYVPPVPDSHLSVPGRTTGETAAVPVVPPDSCVCERDGDTPLLSFPATAKVSVDHRDHEGSEGLDGYDAADGPLPAWLKDGAA